MVDSPIVAAFLRSSLVPAVGAIIFILLASMIENPWRARLQGLVYAGAYVVGAFLLRGQMESFALAALVLAGFVLWSPRALGPRYLLRSLFVLALGVVILWPLKDSVFVPVHYRNLLAFFCLGLGLWSVTEQSSKKVQPLTLFVLPLISATFLSIFFLIKGSAVFSQLVGVSCALIGSLVAISLVWPQRFAPHAFIPFLSAHLVAMMTAGMFFLDLNPWHLIYLCLPYLLLWIRDWLRFIPENPYIEAAALGLLSGAPLAYFVLGLQT